MGVVGERVKWTKGERGREREGGMGRETETDIGWNRLVVSSNPAGRHPRGVARDVISNSLVD